MPGAEVALRFGEELEKTRSGGVKIAAPDLLHLAIGYDLGGALTELRLDLRAVYAAQGGVAPSPRKTRIRPVASPRRVGLTTHLVPSRLFTSGHDDPNFPGFAWRNQGSQRTSYPLDRLKSFTPAPQGWLPEVSRYQHW